MLSTTVLLLSGLLGVYWALKAQNRFTRLSSLIISLACLGLIAPLAQLRSYAPYFAAFTCFMAGFEPANSRRLKVFHKAFFGVSGLVFAFVAVDRILIWPFDLQFWPFLIVFYLV